MGLVKEDGLLSTTAGSKAPGSSDTPPHRGGGHTSPNRAPREVSCHSCGSRAQGTAQDTGQSLKMGSSSKNPLENPDIDGNSLGCLQISISFIQVRNHLFVSNKWRPAPASFYHMACACPVSVHLSRLCGQREGRFSRLHTISPAGRGHMAWHTLAPPATQPAFQRKGCGGHMVVHL